MAKLGRATPDLETKGEAAREQSNALGVIAFIVAMGFFLGVAFHYYQVHYLGRSYPFSTFLYPPGHAWTDFFFDMLHTRDLDPYLVASSGGSQSNYLPFFHVLLYPLSQLDPKLAYVCFSAIFYGPIFAFLFRKYGLERNPVGLFHALAIVLMSYPILFAWDRGNSEIVLFFFLALFIYFFRIGRHGVATFLLAIPIAIKIYPAVFGALYFQRRDYKSLFRIALWTVFLTFGSFLFFKGGLLQNWEGLLRGLSPVAGNGPGINQDIYLQHGVSLYGMLRLIIGFFVEGFPGNPVAALWYGRLYIVVIAVLCIAGTLVLRKRSLPFFESVTLLMMMMITFVQISFDYKLIHLLIPIYLYLYETPKKRVSFTLIFGFLLIPKAYFLIREDISWGVVLNPLLMILLAVLILTEKQALGSAASRVRVK